MKMAYVVLGMHRSGTSSVVGTLALLGATPPRTLMRPADDNPKGFWESEVMMAVDDAILAACGSRWDDWRQLPSATVATLQDGDLARLANESLRAEFGDAEAIVLKDPRICRFYPLWRRWLIAAGYRPMVIMPIRSPIEVASSLQARNGFPRHKGFRLWLRHVLEAEQASRGDARFIFDWARLMADWRATIGAIDRRLGTDLTLYGDANADALNTFLTTDLRRQRADTLDHESLPAWVQTTWQDLQALSTNPEDPATQARLDHTHQAFDTACDLFDDPASPDQS